MNTSFNFIEKKVINLIFHLLQFLKYKRVLKINMKLEIKIQKIRK